MFGQSHTMGRAGANFLPEDYLAKRAERRTNILALTLFFVVITSVVGAFFVTNRKWSSVKTQQEMINVRYTQAAKDIEQLKQLETQKEQMLDKAEITAALIEKAPRSVLLAELINRMPDKLSLLKMELASERIKRSGPSRRARRSRGASRSLAGGEPRRRDDEKNSDENSEPAPKPPRYRTNLVLTGVAPAHNEVSEYLASLQNSPLLTAVELKFSEATMMDNRELNKYRIEARLRPDADARSVQPLAENKPGVFDRASNQERADDPDEARAGVEEREN